MPAGEIQVNLWTILIAIGTVLAATGGIVHAIARSYLGQLRADIQATQNLDVKVAEHAAQISDAARRLTLIEGGLVSQMRGLDERMTQLNIAVVRLETALNIKESIRGMIGKRVDDKEGV